MFTIEKFLLFVALPTVILASLLEALVLSRRQAYDWRAMGVSMVDLFLRTSITILVPLSIATPVVKFVVAHRLTNITLDSWQAFLLLFFGQEFCYYWYHRAAHRVRWFWGNHSVHHSPNDLNLSAAYRIGITGRLSGTVFFFIPLIWLGFSEKIVAATLTLNLLYQFWIHATWIPKLGFLEGWINTPSAHRVHHAANLEYLDANYGGVLLIFDRLFGTYRAERDDVPCRYGWVKPLDTYNPFKVEFGQWNSLVRDLRSARSLDSVYGFLFRPPGWRPNGQSQTTEDLRRQLKP